MIKEWWEGDFELEPISKTQIPACSDDVTCSIVEKILDQDDFDLETHNGSVVLRIDARRMNDRRKHKLMKRLEQFIRGELDIINDGY